MGYLDYPGLQRYHGKVQEEIDELKDDLTAEQTARENADTALQTSINNEKTAREAYGFSVVNGILNVTYTTTEVGGE